MSCESGSKLAISAVIAGLIFLPGVCAAEEGGSGHYMPGSMSSFIDAVPSTETFVARLNLVYYDASADAQRKIPMAGLVTADAAAKSWAYGLTLLWRPSIELGDRWSYAMSTTIPYVSLDVSANITSPVVGSQTSKVDALGDVVLIPIMLNYNVNPDLNAEFRLALYAPTGSYEVGRLANTGKNFWTAEPTIGVRYFGQKNGIEATLLLGADFNQENDDTSYKSGTQLHLDGTLAQHFPFHGGLAGAGISGYYYQQVAGDSGTGATLGDFKGRTVGIGPVLSYVTKIGGHDNIIEVKWLHEVETQNRLEGDIAWLKWVFKFY
ncbi:MAG TPA: transporter [Burkholderiales bacterium]|nr:transporter [Burkholderiales bacterium]